VTNPITGAHEQLVNFLADPVGLRLLHMVTADPKRTPTVVAFAKPDYFISTNPADCSTSAAVIECPPSFGEDAWMQGTVANQINLTWAGLVGPGRRHLGQDGRVWSDHSDLRPTIMLLTGLKDDYVHDGRPLWELVQSRFPPEGLRDNEDLLRLAQLYKQIDALVGALSLLGVRLSTLAITGSHARYRQLEDVLSEITSERDAIAKGIISAIEAAAFGGPEVEGVKASARGGLTDQASQQLERAAMLASGES
jgi:hypothetical protein